MRAFFCIPADSKLKERIGSIASRLRDATRMRASWVRPENYHLTVRFLGEIDPVSTVELDELCRHVAIGVPPFDVILDRVGAFPSPERARVIWVGGTAPSAYVALTSSLNERLREMGFPQDRNETLAHVTLARVKGAPDPVLARSMDALNPLPGWMLHADRIVLMESQLTLRGAIYTPLFTIRLDEGAEVSERRGER
jgi:2'-5' RNA ligase